MNSRRIRLALEIIKGNYRYYAGTFISNTLSVFIGFLTPLLMGFAIDSVIGTAPFNLPVWLNNIINNAGGREMLVNNLWILGILLIVLNTLDGAFLFIRGKLSATASENIALTIRDRVYRHLQHLSYNYHVKAETGDLLQRCTSDVETIRRFLSMQVVQIFNALLMISIAITILSGINVRMMLISLIMVPLIFMFSYFYFKKIVKTFRVSDEAEGAMSAVLQENLTGVRVVRAFGRQKFEVEKFDKVNNEYCAKSWSVSKNFANFWAASDFMTMAQTGLTLIVGIIFASRGELSVGELTIFMAYIGRLLWPVRQLGRILSDLGKSLVSLERIDEILRQPAEADPEDALEPELNGDIVFENVSFFYDKNNPVLNDISFTVKPGQTVAILGSTGSGKSTIMHLLQRLYDVKGGRITIGGVDIRNIKKKWLRSRIGLVLQEPFLYSKSIKDNLAIAAPKGTEDEVIYENARVAHAHDFILEFDKGYETQVGERGVTLSGGQKQRAAIARTLIKGGDVMIFDDSLSAVDTETDAAIRRALKEKRKGVTTFIISHRITTLSEADFIFVLENGEIVQRGTHDELISQDGLYQRIFKIQNTLESELESEISVGSMEVV